MNATSGGGGNAMELISTQVLSSTTASITFASIPQTYKHLQLRMVARSAEIAGNTRVEFVPGTNAHYLNGNGSSVTSGNAAAGNVYIPANNVSTNIFATLLADYLDYSSTTKNKTTRLFWGSNPDFGNAYIQLASVGSFSTSAITSITVVVSSGAGFIAGSRFSLYGIKG
jgi:hypothetical protein